MVMMKQIALILPYFGKLPNYFGLFLQSCSHNPQADFFIFTDAEIETSPPNVKITNISFSGFVKRIQSKFDFLVNIKSPYKLCDFKPAYGYIFEELIANYPYWGYCDCDLIFGNLNLLKPYIEEGHDRIGVWAHLMIYKNTKEVNRWFINLHNDLVPTFEEIAKDSRCRFFDEYMGMDILVGKNNKDWCKEWLFDDIIFYCQNFYSKRRFNNCELSHRTPIYFKYQEGRLIRYIYIDNHWKTDESLYVHLQKRKMSVETNDIDNYYIIPNRFVGLDYEEKKRLKSAQPPFIDYTYHKLMIKAKIKSFINRLT